MDVYISRRHRNGPVFLINDDLGLLVKVAEFVYMGIEVVCMLSVPRYRL